MTRPPFTFDLSATSKVRVALLTVLGTLACIAIALTIDSFSTTGGWQLQDRWTNNILIPLVIAPPFFLFLLVKLRELAIAHRELMVVASTDSLTSCLTRRAFTALVDGYMERLARGAPKEGALLIIDVDHFKAVNDGFGHESGDEALRVVAKAIKSAVRDIDLVGRMGGEEFSVFLPGVDDTVSRSVAERIRRAVNAAEFEAKGRRCALAVSVGGATFQGETTFSELFRSADERLYEAKRKGRNRVEFAPVENAAVASLH